MSYKILNPNGAGGRPLKNDDLLLLQDRILEFMTALLKPYGLTIPESFVFSGCEVVVNGSNYDVSDGYIAYQGELVSVPAHSVAIVGGQIYYWSLLTNTDQSRVHEDSSSHDMREERYMNLVGAVSPPGSYMPLAAPRFEDLVQLASSARLDDIEGAWKSYVPAAYFADAGATYTPGQVDIRYKIVGKTMVINFRVEGTVSGASTASVGFDLPETRAAKAQFKLESPCVISDGTPALGRVLCNQAPAVLATRLQVYPPAVFPAGGTSADLRGQVWIELA